VSASFKSQFHETMFIVHAENARQCRQACLAGASETTTKKKDVQNWRQFGSQISAAIPFAMNSEFSPILASEMKRANVIGSQPPVIARPQISIVSQTSVCFTFHSLLSFQKDFQELFYLVLDRLLVSTARLPCFGWVVMLPATP